MMCGVVKPLRVACGLERRPERKAIRVQYAATCRGLTIPGLPYVSSAPGAAGAGNSVLGAGALTRRIGQ